MAGGETVTTLPEAYGTQRLKLTPRDPHWIHAHWDFTRRQLLTANARSAEGHLVLRLFEQSTQGRLVSETQVHPESVRWMMHVLQPGISYAAEIGLYDTRRRWSALAASEAATTPPVGASADRRFEVATLTADGGVQRHGDVTTTTTPMELRTGLPPAARGWGDPMLNSAGLSADGAREVGEGFVGDFSSACSSLGLSSWSQQNR